MCRATCAATDHRGRRQRKRFLPGDRNGAEALGESCRRGLGERRRARQDAGGPLVRHRDVTGDLRRVPGAACRLGLGRSGRQLAELRDERTLSGVEAGKSGSGTIDRHRASKLFQISDFRF
jgi:hypothetical protein